MPENVNTDTGGTDEGASAVQKRTMTSDQLRDMISGIVKDVVTEQVQSAIEPLTTQQTEWFENIRSDVHKSVNAKTPELGIGAARFVRAMAFGKGDPNRAKWFAAKAWDDPLGASIEKALMAGDFTAGGFMVPPEFTAEIIELLRSTSVVRAAGARTVPMNMGSLTLPKQTGAATVAYVGESRPATASEPVGGQIQMTAKKLVGLVPISNDLLSFAPGDAADSFVRDDLVAGIAVKEDASFIRDDGMSEAPKGMRFWALPANVTATNGTSSTNIEDDFKDLLNNLEGADVRMIRPAFFMSPRSKNHLITLRDSNGNLIYPEMRTRQPTIHTWPVFVTTNIPNNLGNGSDETEIYFVDMADAIIAESDSLEIAVDASASYTTGGNLVSTFERDETLMRAIVRHDFAMRHDESVAVKTAVVWGA